MPQVSFSEFIAAAQAGELVSFPTDTVPALAARPDCSDRIFQLKHRSQSKPLILMGANLQDLLPYVVGTLADFPIWQAMAAQYWPGALTLVLPASSLTPPAMNPEQTGTIGLRIPNHPLARYLLEQTGPLATTSINRSGEPPLETMTTISEQFPEVVLLSQEALEDLYPPLVGTAPPPFDRPQGSGQPSTVVRWNGQSWDLLRQGEIQLTNLNSA